MKNEAISRTRGLVFLTFAATLAAAFGLPPLFELILGDSPNDVTKTTLTVFTSLTLGLFWAWFSPEITKSVIGNAIESTTKEEIDRYKEQHPNAEKVLKDRELEYACAILPVNRNESSIQISSLNPSIYNKWLARNAVIKILSCNDDLVRAIAFSSARRAIEQIHGKRRKVDQGLEDIFFQDIYVYLKGWLIMSITHKCTMPIIHIQQRYPSTHHPNRYAYITALKIIKSVYIRTLEVYKATSVALEPMRNATLQEDEVITQAVNILDEYLTTLINEIETAAP